MARSEARLQFGMWREGLEGHSPHAKLMYAVLLTEPTVNQAGVGAVRLPRWARNASLSVEEAQKALAELAGDDPLTAQVLLDEDTEEVLIRTLIRNDGVVEQPFVLKGALAQALQVASPLLRWVLANELRKLPPRLPDGVSKAGRKIVYGDPHATANVLDPPGFRPPGTRDPLGWVSKGSPKGLGEETRRSEATPPETGGSDPKGSRDPLERERGSGSGSGKGSVGLDSPSEVTRTKPRRDDVEALCKHLQDRIVANGSKPPTHSAADTWRVEARRLLDIDKRDPAEAHRLIDWCQEDHFWRSNILGMPKFRKQYDAIRLQAGNRSHLRAVVGGGNPDTGFWEQ